MNQYLKLNLRALWLMTACVSLALPVFLPSSANPHNFLANVIGTATATMFILSFPASLLGLPLLYFVQVILGFDPNTIGGMYLNLWLLFVLGLVQWFWIMPRVLGKGQKFQTLDLSQGPSEILLTEARSEAHFGFYDRESRTPVERVIKDEEAD